MLQNRSALTSVNYSGDSTWLSEAGVQCVKSWGSMLPRPWHLRRRLGFHVQVMRSFSGVYSGKR